MSETILKIENLSKQYRLGLVGTGTLGDDLKRWWHLIRGKEDPFLKVGDTNNRATKGESDYVWALQDINFEVKRGEVLGIIGKNGAGKSTLLKILSKVTGPTTGSIKSRGRIASLLEVGTGFHPELTGKENVFLNGAILGMTKGEIKVKYNEIVEFSGCQRYIDTPVKRYSSGMRVRLAFAVAAFLEPDILVIDEVLAVGDAEFQKKAIGKMQDISKGEGRTVLFVSHNMAAVQNLCTRCIILKDGTSIFEGATDIAIDKYLSVFSENKNDVVFPIKCGDIIIEDFSILNNEKLKIDNLILGSKYTFTINFKSVNTKTKINIRFQIFDEKENLVTTMNTYHLGTEYVLEKNSTCSAECIVEKFPLSKGNYNIGVEILDLNNRKVLFTNNCIKSFFIDNGDFFGSGKLPSSQNSGRIMLDHKWIIK